MDLGADASHMLVPVGCGWSWTRRSCWTEKYEKRCTAYDRA